ncbi:MAG: DNA-directed RNA polymerase subunit K [Candidatus Aenigmatarchaeota archaeon]|nr:DNA-directed RNA polymerase subunit K [Candidatus Aenigmarchaeota archaeon]
MSEEKDTLTRFERARIIGARALQIARGAPILLKTEETDPVRIAEAEFAAGVIPLKVRRKAPAKQRAA